MFLDASGYEMRVDFVQSVCAPRDRFGEGNTQGFRAPVARPSAPAQEQRLHRVVPLVSYRLCAPPPRSESVGCLSRKFTLPTTPDPRQRSCGTRDSGCQPLPRGRCFGAPLVGAPTGSVGPLPGQQRRVGWRRSPPSPGAPSGERLGPASRPGPRAAWEEVRVAVARRFATGLSVYHVCERFSLFFLFPPPPLPPPPP